MWSFDFWLEAYYLNAHSELRTLLSFVRCREQVKDEKGSRIRIPFPTQKPEERERREMVCILRIYASSDDWFGLQNVPRSFSERRVELESIIDFPTVYIINETNKLTNLELSTEKVEVHSTSAWGRTEIEFWNAGARIRRITRFFLSIPLQSLLRYE